MAYDVIPETKKELRSSLSDIAKGVANKPIANKNIIMNTLLFIIKSPSFL